MTMGGLHCRADFVRGGARTAMALCSSVLVIGCAPQVDFHKAYDPAIAQSQIPMRASFAETSGSGAAGSQISTSPDVSAGDQVGDHWLDTFHDAALSDLVDEAMKANPDLHRLAAIHDEALAMVRSAHSDLLPSLYGYATTSREDDGRRLTTTLRVKAEIAWEIDLWNRLGNIENSAHAQAQATAADYGYARQSLAALIADAWFTAITAKNQIIINQDRLKAEAFTAKVAGARAQAGTTTPLEQELTQANVLLAQRALTASQSAQKSAVRAIEMLLGRYPSGELDISDQTLPALPPVPATGLPAQLLERREDVMAADRRIAAAFYQLQSTRAAALPRIDLTASLGELFDPGRDLWSIAGDLLAPLFTGDALQAAIDGADARQKAAVASYVAVALKAFNEVESALSDERSLDAQVASLSSAQDQLSQAMAIAESRYQAGILTIFELDQVRQSYFDTRSQLLAARHALLGRRLDLYLALGGSFETSSSNRKAGSQEMTNPSQPVPTTNPASIGGSSNGSQ